MAHKTHLGMSGEISATITPEMIEHAKVKFGDETGREDFDTDDDYNAQLAIMWAREMWHEMIDAHPTFVATEMNIEWVEVDHV